GGAPGSGGVLRWGGGGKWEDQENAERGTWNAEHQGRVELRRGACPAVPRSDFRVPRFHGSLARSRRKFSIPRTSPRAYRPRPSSFSNIASCSGTMMKRPSVSAAGIHVGRTSA